MGYVFLQVHEYCLRKQVVKIALITRADRCVVGSWSILDHEKFGFYGGALGHMWLVFVTTHWIEVFQECRV